MGEAVGKLVDVVGKGWRGCLQVLEIGAVDFKTAEVDDVDPRAEYEGGALLESSGGVKDLHRVHHRNVGELPYPTRQLPIFYQ